MNDLFTRCPIPAIDLPQSLANAVAIHNLAVDEALEHFSEYGDDLDDAFRGDDVQAMVLARDVTPAGQAVALGALRDLWAKRGELCAKLRDHFKAEAVKLEKEHADSVRTTAEGLTTLGMGVDAQPAARTNPRAAETQLIGLVKLALPVRKAETALADAKNQVATCEQWRRDSESGAVETKTAIHKLVTGSRNRFATAS